MKIEHILTIKEFESALSALNDIFSKTTFKIKPKNYSTEGDSLKGNSRGYTIHVISDKGYGACGHEYDSYLSKNPEECLEFYKNIVKYKDYEISKDVYISLIEQHSNGYPSSMERKFSRFENEDEKKYSFFSVVFFSSHFKATRSTLKALGGL